MPWAQRFWGGGGGEGLACCVHGESGDSRAWSDMWRIWVAGRAWVWAELQRLGVGTRDPRCSLAGARQEPAEGAQVARRARMLALTQRRAAVVGLGPGLGLRAVRMESLRVC